MQDLVYLLHANGIGLPMHEHGRVSEEGLSGEEDTPGRSRPLELCSTEDHRTTFTMRR